MAPITPEGRTVQSRAPGKLASDRGSRWKFGEVGEGRVIYLTCHNDGGRRPQHHGSQVT